MTNSAELQNGYKRWWPFAALCALLLLRWNLAENYPQAADTVPSQALGCGLAALLCLAWAFRARAARPEIRSLLLAAEAGALLLAGPELALLFPNAPVNASALLLALGLTPVVVAVAVGARSVSAGVSSALLGPGIAVMCGLLLMLPEPNLGNPYADAVLLLTPLFAGLGCFLFRDQATGEGWWTTAAAFAGATAVFALGALCQTIARGTLSAVSAVSPWTVLGDALLAWLAVLAVSRVAAMQYAARFAVVPLLALVEGWVLLRLPLTLRPLVGLGLLTVGAFGLLRKSNAEPADEPLSLVP